MAQRTFGHLSEQDLVSRLMSEHIGGGGLEANTASILQRLGISPPGTQQQAGPPDVWINVPGRGTTPPGPAAPVVTGQNAPTPPPGGPPPGGPPPGSQSQGFFSGMWESIQRNPEAWIRLLGVLGGPRARGPATAAAGAVEIGTGGGRSKAYQRVLAKQAAIDAKQRSGQPVLEQERLTTEERVILAQGVPRDPGTVALETSKEIEAAERAANPPLPEMRIPSMPAGSLSRGAGGPLMTSQEMASPLALLGQRRFAQRNPFAAMPQVGK